MYSRGRRQTTKEELTRERGNRGYSISRSLVADKDHVFLTWENIIFTVPHRTRRQQPIDARPSHIAGTEVSPVIIPDNDTVADFGG